MVWCKKAQSLFKLIFLAVITLFIFILYSQFSSPSLVQVVTPDTGIISDAYVNSASPGTTTGTETSMYLLTYGREYSSYLMFNISGVSITNLEKVELFFYVNLNNLDASTEGFNVSSYRIYQFPTYNISDAEWDESTITYNTRPISVLGHNSTASDTKKFYGGAGEPIFWQNLNVTSIVLEDLNAGNLNTSILLNASSVFGTPASDDYLRIVTKEGAEGNRPYLLFTYADDSCSSGQCNFTGEEILADVEVDDDTFNYQTEIAMKWNVSELNNYNIDTIDSAELCLYTHNQIGSPNNDVRYHYFTNQTWDETVTTSAYNGFSKINGTTTTYNGTTDETFMCFNITTAVTQNYIDGNSNLSFRFYDPDKTPDNTAGAISDSLAQYGIGDATFLNEVLFYFRPNEWGLLSQRPTLTIKFTENTPPLITSVSPTPNNEYINYSNITINITCDQTCHTAILDWNGTNESMSGSGTNWYKSKNITNGNYTFQVYANSSAGLMNVSQTRWVWKNIPVSTVNESATNVSKTIYTYPTTSVNQTFHWYGDLNRDIDKCIFDWNGTNYTSSPSGLNCSYTINITSKGNYTFTAYINDSSGELDSSNTYWLKFFFAKDPAGYWVARAPVDPAEIDAGDYFGRRGGYEGNGQDTGVFLRDDTLDDYGNLLQDEERHCGAWGVWYFNEDNYTEGEIEEMYCKGWGHSTNTASAGAKIGFDNSDKYDATTFDLGTIQFQTTPSFPNNATQYYLIVYNDSSFDYEYDDDYDADTSLWDVAFKVSGGDIQLLSYPNQKTYCIVNNIGGVKLSNQTGLSAQDTDGDGVDDWTELYTTYTDPYDVDTDNDTRDDDFERDNSKKGYDPYDWGTIHYYYANDSSFNITYKLLNNQTSEPFVDKPNVTLSTEFNSTQYNNLRYYDNVNTILPYNISTGSARWGLDQVNLNVTINQDVDSIQYVNIFMGGKASGSYSGIDLEENVIRALNISSGTNDYIASGKKGVTRAIFLEQVRENFTDLIDDNNRMFVTWYNKVNKSIDAGYVDYLHYLDYAEIWVITGGSLVSIVAPTTASPLTVENSTFIMVNYTLTEEGTTIVNGVTTQNITIDGELCTLNGVASYSDSKWQQNCTTPNKVFGSYDLQIYANTSSSGLLTDTETNAITYSGATVIILSEGIVNQDFLNRKGDFIRYSLLPTSIFDTFLRLFSGTRNIFDNFLGTGSIFKSFFNVRINLASIGIDDFFFKIFGTIRQPIDSLSITSYETSTNSLLRNPLNIINIFTQDNILYVGNRIINQPFLIFGQLTRNTFLTSLINQPFLINSFLSSIFSTDRLVLIDFSIFDSLLSQQNLIRLPLSPFYIFSSILNTFSGIRTPVDNLLASDSLFKSFGTQGAIFQNFNIFTLTDSLSSFVRLPIGSFNVFSSLLDSQSLLRIPLAPLSILSNLFNGFSGVRTLGDSAILNSFPLFNKGITISTISAFLVDNSINRIFGGLRINLVSLNIFSLIGNLGQSYLVEVFQGISSFTQMNVLLAFSRGIFDNFFAMISSTDRLSAIRLNNLGFSGFTSIFKSTSFTIYITQGFTSITSVFSHYVDVLIQIISGGGGGGVKIIEKEVIKYLKSDNILNYIIPAIIISLVLLWGFYSKKKGYLLGLGKRKDKSVYQKEVISKYYK